MEPGLSATVDNGQKRSDSQNHASSNDSGPFSGVPKGLIVKGVCIVGGLYLLRKLSSALTRKDHVQNIVDLLNGEKFSADQAIKDPENFFNLRLDSCPSAELPDGARVLYCEQAFWRSPAKPFRQRFYVARPCTKEMKCDVELASYAVKDVEEYRNFCSRPKNQRPLPEEVPQDITEHLATVYLSRCERGKKCAYEGSTPPGGFPNSWNGATKCTSEITLFRSGEIHSWDRGFNDDGKQVWGSTKGPYEYKPRGLLSCADQLPPLDASRTF